MKSHFDRKTFLQATLATTLVGVIGCSGEDDGTTGGDGDGDGAGGSDTGSGGSTDAGTGGSTGSGTGGGTNSNTGGSDAGTGGSDPGTGGTDPGTGGDGTGGGDVGPACNADITVTGSDSGHVHTFTITVAEMTAGVGFTKDTSTDFGHEHSITLTAEQVMTIRDGGEVIIDACSQNPHQFVITCRANPTPAGAPSCQ